MEDSVVISAFNNAVLSETMFQNAQRETKFSVCRGLSRKAHKLQRSIY
jgi:hypothetical protein